MFLNSVNYHFVNYFLISLPLIARLVFLLLFTEDITFLLLRALVAFPLEIVIIDVCRQFDAGDIQFCGGGDYIILTDSSQGARIDQEWSYNNLLIIINYNRVLVC